MFFSTHLNPRARDDPSNMLFWGDLILDFKFGDEVVFERAVKTVFVKHFSAWMSPSNVALNVHLKGPVFQLKHFKSSKAGSTTFSEYANAGLQTCLHESLLQ